MVAPSLSWGVIVCRGTRPCDGRALSWGVVMLGPYWASGPVGRGGRCHRCGHRRVVVKRTVSCSESAAACRCRRPRPRPPWGRHVRATVVVGGGRGGIDSPEKKGMKTDNKNKRRTADNGERHINYNNAWNSESDGNCNGRKNPCGRAREQFVGRKTQNPWPRRQMSLLLLSSSVGSVCVRNLSLRCRRRRRESDSRQTRRCVRVDEVLRK